MGAKLHISGVYLIALFLFFLSAGLSLAASGEISSPPDGISAASDMPIVASMDALDRMIRETISAVIAGLWH